MSVNSNAPGFRKMEEYRAANFTEDEIAAWRAAKEEELFEAKFTVSEIGEYFGEITPDFSDLEEKIRKNVGDYLGQEIKKAETEQSYAEPADTFLKSIEAGLEMSVSGLMTTGKPDTVLPENAPMANRIGFQIGMLTGDFPAMAAGAAVGGLAGTAAAGPGAGTAIGAGAGAFAVPEGMREYMMQKYERGEVDSAAEFWERTLAVAGKTVKGAVLGGVTAGGGIVAGRAAGGIALQAGATAQTAARIGTTAATAGEIITMTNLGARLEGQSPEPVHFFEAAVMVFGMQAAGKAGAAGVKKLRNIYARAGIKPADIVEHSKSDPVLRQELLSNSTDIPTRYKAFVEVRPGVEQPKKYVLAPDNKLNKTFDGLAPESNPKPIEIPLTPEKAMENVKSRIGSSDAPKQEGPFTTWDKVETAVFDDLHPLSVAVKSMVDPEQLTATENPYILRRLNAGNAGRGDAFINFGPSKFEDFSPTGSRGLKQILEPIKENVGEFDAYAIAKRAIEKEKQGIKTGVDVESAKLVVKEKASKFEPILKEVQEYRERTLDYLIDSEIVSKESAEAFRATNKDYVPFYRLREEGAGGTSARGAVKNPVKGMTGSEKQIVSPIESIVRDTYTFIELAERNRVANAFVKIAESSPDAAAVYGIKKSKVDMRKIEVSVEETKKVLRDLDLPEDNAEAFSIFRPDKSQLADNQFVVFREGKREVWEAHPEIVKTLRTVDQETMPVLFKLMKYPAAIMRAGITLAPEFGVRNWIRDQAQAVAFSKNGLGAVDSLKAIGSVFKNDKAYQEFLASGAANATIMDFDSKFIRTDLLKLEKQTGFISSARNIIKKPIEVLEVWSTLLETSTRVAEFQRAKASGKSSAQAALSAREITLDFAKAGAKMRALNQIAPFLTATIGGNRRIFDAIKDDPIAVSLKLSAVVTTPSLLLWAAQHDDPRWNDVPAWQKAAFWIVMTDDWKELTPEQAAAMDPEKIKNINGKPHINDGIIYRIPKPPVIGQIYGSLPEAVLDSFSKKNPDAAKELLKQVGGQIMPGVIPSALIPVIEQYSNRSLFMGTKIVPGSKEDLLPQYQYTDFTSETAKKLGGFLADHIPGMKESSLASPMVIENYIRAWSGTLGTYALQITEESLKRFGVVDDKEMAAKTLSDLPFIKSFVVRYPSASAPEIERFYDRTARMQKVFATIDHLYKTGEFVSAEQERKYWAAEGIVANLAPMRKALTSQTRFILNVAKDKSMTREERREIIDRTYQAMIFMARSMNQSMDQIEQDFKKQFEEQEK